MYMTLFMTVDCDCTCITWLVAIELNGYIVWCIVWLNRWHS